MTTCPPGEATVMGVGVPGVTGTQLKVTGVAATPEGVGVGPPAFPALPRPPPPPPPMLWEKGSWGGRGLPQPVENRLDPAPPPPPARNILFEFTDKGFVTLLRLPPTFKSVGVQLGVAFILPRPTPQQGLPLGVGRGTKRVLKLTAGRPFIKPNPLVP